VPDIQAQNGGCHGTIKGGA